MPLLAENGKTNSHTSPRICGSKGQQLPRNPRPSLTGGSKSSSLRSDPTPAPYPSHLTPNPSARRPHCLARERLFLWKPVSARQATDATGRSINLSDMDLQRILSVMSHAWAEGTLETYALGLLAWCKGPNGQANNLNSV